jgi:hypothetical protein
VECGEFTRGSSADEIAHGSVTDSGFAVGIGGGTGQRAQGIPVWSKESSDSGVELEQAAESGGYSHRFCRFHCETGDVDLAESLCW